MGNMSGKDNDDNISVDINDEVDDDINNGTEVLFE